MWTRKVVCVCAAASSSWMGTTLENNSCGIAKDGTKAEGRRACRIVRAFSADETDGYLHPGTMESCDEQQKHRDEVGGSGRLV